MPVPKQNRLQLSRPAYAWGSGDVPGRERLNTTQSPRTFGAWVEKSVGRQPSSIGWIETLLPQAVTPGMDVVALLKKAEDLVNDS